MEKIDLIERVKAYLLAFDSRDLTRCIDFFDDDACIYFLSDVFRGKEAIKRWHKDRFVADLRIIDVKGMSVEKNEIRLKGSIVSKRIVAWPAINFNIVLIASFEQEKIKNVRFGLGAICT